MKDASTNNPKAGWLLTGVLGAIATFYAFASSSRIAWFIAVFLVVASVRLFTRRGH